MTARRPRSSIAKLLLSQLGMGKTQRNATTDSGKGGRGGRGGRRGGRADGPPSREVTISKAMSYVLRHAADREGLRLDANGYARASDLVGWSYVRHRRRRHASLAHMRLRLPRPTFRIPVSTLALTPNVDADPSATAAMAQAQETERRV